MLRHLVMDLKVWRLEKSGWRWRFVNHGYMGIWYMMGKLGWTRSKCRAEDWALINGIYWLRKGGAPSGKWLERSKRRLETGFPETSWSMPLSSQVQNQNLYPKPMHGSLFWTRDPSLAIKLKSYLFEHYNTVKGDMVTPSGMSNRYRSKC